MDQTFDIAHYWAQGDAVTHTVAYILLAMSLLSWYFILSKAFSHWRSRNNTLALDHFWSAPSFDEALHRLAAHDPEAIFTPLAKQGIAIAVQHSNTASTAGSLDVQGSADELITRTLRREINRTTAQLDRGSTLLASVGATAPFIGLFGTVWGIYHALVAISSSGTVQIGQIAGPVGEALIMTALGLAVAIPAVLAYNAFQRSNRIILAELDGFAHDLHIRLTNMLEGNK
jgi:biopolymer transport protein ExbB